MDENILSLLSSETTSLNTLQALKKTYDAQLEEKFPMACGKCGSQDISRSSSITNTSNNELSDSHNGNTVYDSINAIAKAKLKTK